MQTAANTAPTYSLECAYETDCGWESVPFHGYHYSVKALAEKLAERLGGSRGDVCVIEHRAPTAQEIAERADHCAHVVRWMLTDDMDIPF